MHLRCQKYTHSRASNPDIVHHLIYLLSIRVSCMSLYFIYLKKDIQGVYDMAQNMYHYTSKICIKYYQT